MGCRSLSEGLLDGIVARLRDVEPRLQAVLLCGSFARGTADRFSDVDILAVTDGDPVLAERTWLVPDSHGQTLHISIGAESLESFVEVDGAPADWALGFPVLDSMKLLWATARGRVEIGEEPSERLPAGSPRLEDFAEIFMKIRRAEERQDRVLLRWAARQLAEHSVGLVQPFNPRVEVCSPVEALDCALALKEVPSNYRGDFEICAGLRAASDREIYVAAERMQQELLTWLRLRLEDESFALDDSRALLRDGSLQAYLAS